VLIVLQTVIIEEATFYILWGYIFYSGQNAFQSHAGQAAKFRDHIIIAIIVLVINLLNAGGNGEFGAVNTGEVGDIKGGAVNADTASGGVRNSILFGVDCIDFVPFAHHACMGCSGGESVISGRNHPVLFDEDGADAEAWAGGANGQEEGHRAEIFVPGEPVRTVFQYQL